MTTDTLRTEANERVDLEDFYFATDASLRANAKHWGEQFFADPVKDRSWVLSGFVMSGVGGLPSAQFQVDLGRAILGSRRGGETFYGSLVSEGDAQRIIDVSTYSAGTYGVYVRFELIDGDSSSRAFWNPQGTGSEIAQTIPTRRLANWSLRLELSTPGAEWLKIGEAVVDATPEVTTITEQRDFYFEGEEHNTYESGWSTEGGGIANDRNSDRQQYGVFDLHTFGQATRQCLEDLKGRGLRRWWDKGIGGINVGFDDDPAEKRLATGDANFNLTHSSPGAASIPRITFDPNDYVEYDRSGNYLDFNIDATLELRIMDGGLGVAGGLTVGYFGSPPGTYTLSVRDAEFKLDATTITTPRIWFHATSGDDYIQFTRADNDWDWFLGGVSEMNLSPAGLIVTNGGVFGHVGTPVDDVLSVGDANFAMLFNTGTVPYIQFESGTGDGFNIGFVRSTNTFRFRFDGVERVEMKEDQPLILTPPTSSAKGTMRFFPLTSDPSTPFGGELFRHDSSEQLSYYDGRRQQTLNPYVYELLEDSLDIDGDGGSLVWIDFTIAGPTVIKYPIPANTLRAGTVIKIKAAGGTIDGGADDSIDVGVYLGGILINADLNADSVLTTNGTWTIEVEITMRDGPGATAGYGISTVVYWGPGFVTASVVGHGEGSGTVASNGALDLKLQARFGTGVTAANKINMTLFNASIH